MKRGGFNTKLKILKLIHERGEIDFGELREEMKLSKTSLAEHLDDLMKRGLILKRQSERDKRKFIYHLNPNELILISVGEIINGLRRHGIELNEEEAEKLREFLLRGYRPYIEKKMREGKFDEREVDILSESLGFLVASINLFELVERTQKAIEEKEEEQKEGVQDLNVLDIAIEMSESILSDMHIAVLKGMKILPKTLIDKIRKSEFYQRHLLTSIFNEIQKYLITIAESAQEFL